MQAEVCFNEGVTFAKAADLGKLEVDCLAGLGIMYRTQGEPEKAVQMLTQVRRIRCSLCSMCMLCLTLPGRCPMLPWVLFFFKSDFASWNWGFNVAYTNEGSYLRALTSLTSIRHLL